MSYSVVWSEDAENDLAAIWIDATDRKQVRDAVDSVEERLYLDATSVGESRDGQTRIVLKGPLRFLFNVYPDESLAVVWSVKRIRKT